MFRDSERVAAVDGSTAGGYFHLQVFLRAAPLVGVSRLEDVRAGQVPKSAKGAAPTMRVGTADPQQGLRRVPAGT
jgi:hypothetical protein